MSRKQYKSDIEKTQEYTVTILQGWWKLAKEDPKGNAMYRAQCFIHGAKIFSSRNGVVEELIFLSEILETIEG